MAGICSFTGITGTGVGCAVAALVGAALLDPVVAWEVDDTTEVSVVVAAAADVAVVGAVAVVEAGALEAGDDVNVTALLVAAVVAAWPPQADRNRTAASTHTITSRGRRPTPLLLT
jgi:hypothetical protein